MKKLLSALFLLFSVGVFASAPALTYISINNLYIPKGFDSNDNIELILSGSLPNLCFKQPQSKFKIVDKKIFVEVKAYHFESEDPFCPEVLVSFMEPLKVGLLESGNYEVVVNEGTEHEFISSLNVDEASNETSDNFIYANVDSIEKKDFSREIILKGVNPSSCFQLDQIIVLDNGVDTYIVLPTLKKVQENCEPNPVRFSYKVTLPHVLDIQTVLIHVRSMNGNSVNSLYNNYLPNE